jgi:hypothetical protein
MLLQRTEAILPSSNLKRPIRVEPVWRLRAAYRVYYKVLRLNPTLRPF